MMYTMVNKEKRLQKEMTDVWLLCVKEETTMYSKKLSFSKIMFNTCLSIHTPKVTN